MLIFKGRQEYQETMNAWKQVPHIMKWFAEEEVSREEGTWLKSKDSGKEKEMGKTGRRLEKG